jgi:hypothetical protein
MFTVNFDQLIEAELSTRLRVLATKEELEDSPGVIDEYLGGAGRIPLVKLHGTIEKPESIVADIEATARGLSPGTSQGLRRLLSSDSPISWVYIGYSMRDPDLNEVFAVPEFSAGAFEKWVSPFPDQSVRDFVEQHRVARWSGGSSPSFLERSITETADRFLRRLNEAWPASR